jgi:hypothetical protein
MNRLFIRVASRKQPRHLGDRRVENAKDKLWRDADGKHEQCDRDDDEFFASQEIGKSAATFCKWAAKEGLDRSYENDGCDQQPDHGNGRKPGGDRK